MMNNPPPSRHERRRQQTRSALIQATLQLVLEIGYDAVSIQDITERADLGRGTFYLHFKDKEEVVWTAIKAIFQDLEAEAHAKLDRDLPQMEYYGLLLIFRHAHQNPDLYRAMLGRQGSALLASRAQDFLAEAFLQDIRHASRTAEVDFGLPEQFEAQLLTGVVTRLLFWWLDVPQRYSPEEMAAMTYQALYQKQPPDAPTRLA
jgi:AcrR family transcriptional regulator